MWLENMLLTLGSILFYFKCRIFLLLMLPAFFAHPSEVADFEYFEAPCISHAHSPDTKTIDGLVVGFFYFSAFLVSSLFNTLCGSRCAHLVLFWGFPIFSRLIGLIKTLEWGWWSLPARRHAAGSPTRARAGRLGLHLLLTHTHPHLLHADSSAGSNNRSKDDTVMKLLTRGVRYVSRMHGVKKKKGLDFGRRVQSLPEQRHRVEDILPSLFI